MLRLPNRPAPIENLARARANTGAWMMLGIILIVVAIGLLRRFG